MDDNNQTNPKEVAENTDLAKQYQQILDQYSQELTKTEPAVEPVKAADTNSEPEPVPAPEAPIEIPSEPELTPDLPLVDAPIEVPTPPVSSVSEPDILTPPPIVAESPIASEIPVSSELTTSPKTSGGFFKFLFFISLIIFLGVCGAILFTVISSKQNSTSTAIPTTVEMVAPTVASTNVCQLNDQNYPVGQSFPAADGCNTCTCQSDLTISCTNEVCEATPSVSLVPTKVATSSAKITPTKVITPTLVPLTDSGPLKTILASINTALKTAYKETSLDNGKTWSVNLTKSYSKANTIVMEKALTDYGLMLQSDLSGSAGADWKDVYVKTADTCTLQYLQSVLTLSCGN